MAPVLKLRLATALQLYFTQLIRTQCYYVKVQPLVKIFTIK